MIVIIIIIITKDRRFDAVQDMRDGLWSRAAEVSPMA